MLRVKMTEEEREGKEYFKKLDMSEYARKSFSMFGGDEQQVKLLVKNELAGVIIDRFGKNVIMIPAGDAQFAVNVNVQVSSHFLGWIMSLGAGIKIVSPDDVIEQMRKEIERLNSQYGL